jgi:hypothetical protein
MPRCRQYDVRPGTSQKLGQTDEPLTAQHEIGMHLNFKRTYLYLRRNCQRQKTIRQVHDLSHEKNRSSGQCRSFRGFFEDSCDGLCTWLSAEPWRRGCLYQLTSSRPALVNTKTRRPMNWSLSFKLSLDRDGVDSGLSNACPDLRYTFER